MATEISCRFGDKIRRDDITGQSVLSRRSLALHSAEIKSKDRMYSMPKNMSSEREESGLSVHTYALRCFASSTV